MAGLTLTVEFSLFPDDTVLGPQFTLSGYGFRDLGSVKASFVNVSGSSKGLQFEKSGVRVQLPREHDVVSVRAAAFAGPFVVSGTDSAGNVLSQVTIPGDNQAHDVQLAHPGIAFVVFAGGGNEGIVESISITVPCD